MKSLLNNNEIKVMSNYSIKTVKWIVIGSIIIMNLLFFSSSVFAHDTKVAHEFTIDSFYVKRDYAYVELDITHVTNENVPILCRVSNSAGKTIASDRLFYPRAGWDTMMINMGGHADQANNVSCR